MTAIKGAVWHCPRMGTIVVYEATDGWRWRMLSPNGKIVADSAEAYSRADAATRAAQSVRERAAWTRVEVRRGRRRQRRPTKPSRRARG